MSNTLINGIIALIEERPEDARAMLRSPEMKVSISDVQARLAASVAKREVAAQIDILRTLLNTSLRTDIDPNYTEEEREGFVEGITHLEDIIYDAILRLKS